MLTWCTHIAALRNSSQKHPDDCLSATFQAVTPASHARLLLLLLLQARHRKHMMIAAIIGCVIIALALGLGLGLGLKPTSKTGECQLGGETELASLGS